MGLPFDWLPPVGDQIYDSLIEGPCNGRGWVGRVEGWYLCRGCDQCACDKGSSKMGWPPNYPIVLPPPGVSALTGDSTIEGEWDFVGHELHDPKTGRRVIINGYCVYVTGTVTLNRGCPDGDA